MFKVALINPPHLKYLRFNREGRCQQKASSFGYLIVPISLTYIAALLRKEGFGLEIIDCMSEENRGGVPELLDKLNDISPQAVIISLSTPTFYNDIAIVKLIKGRINAHIAGIGLHVTVLPEDALSCSQLDSVIRGEPELTSLELIQALSKRAGLEYIKGLSYKNQGKIFHNPDRPFIEDLDNLPFPAQDLLKTHRYRLPNNGEPYASIIPSRGCYYDCIFCQVKNYYGKRLRLRSVGNVISEIEEIITKFNIRNIAIFSDNFTLDRGFVVSFCNELIENKINISWMANSRVNTVDYPLLDLMRKAGCYGISYGVESGSQDILDRAKKGTTIEQIEKAFYWSSELGIKTLAQVILGLPGDNKHTIKQTLKLLIKINPDFVQFNCAVPYPGTELYNLMHKKNYTASLAKWDYFEPRSAIIETDYLSVSQIRKLRVICYIRFYFRLKYFVKLFKVLRKDIKIKKDLINNSMLFLKEWVLNN